MTIIYFGYGSNMLTQRLTARCKSAQFLGVASVAGYALRFHKRSIDKSGKATLITAANETVYGVLFKIANAELPDLDDAEGLGAKSYARDDSFGVRCVESGDEICATAYIATAAAIDRSLAPYDWYHALVIAGATQQGLPEDYIMKLRGIAATADPNSLRPKRLAALAALEAAGYGRLLAAQAV